MHPTISLKVMLYNAENLFLLSDAKLTADHLKLDPVQWQKLSTSIYENKPVKKCLEIAKLIRENKPDLIMWCEVGGFESLDNFNRLFLNDEFSPILIEGNSDRNIDVGFMVRKGMPFYFDVVTNKNRLINFLYPHERNSAAVSHRFSRDAAELHLFTKDRSKPFFVAVLTHLKSLLDPEGVDANGFARRQAELKTLLQVYNDIEKEFKGQVPIAVAGDFNGNASKNNTDTEFAPLYSETQLKDVCELAGLSAKDSITYYQITRSTKAEGKQIDFCFLSPKLAEYLDPQSVQVLRYKDEMGQPMDPPSSLEAKMALPSDHYPLVFTVKDIPLV